MRWIFAVLFVACAVVTCRGQSAGEYDRYGGVLSRAGAKTGEFHVEQINGRWYFVTPEGHAFFSRGATHALECIGLDVARDFFGNPITGSPDLGAVEVFVGR